MKVLSHIVVIAAALALLVGAPYVAFANRDAMQARLAAVDAVSSVPVARDAPSGRFVIFINKDKHPDHAVLADWVTFFSGKDAPLIKEDVTAVALVNDPAGIEMAESLQARLPEHQMTVMLEDPILALSKADEGLFDVLVVSEEVADALAADTVAAAHDVEVVRR